MYTEEVNKIALSSNDDKRIQTFDKVTTFPYGANAFKVCEGEMLSKNKLIELDEDIDISKTEDTDICKTEDTDICKTEDTDICKTEDIDICKTEDTDICKTEDIDNTKTEDTDICKTKDKDKDKDKTTLKIKSEDKDQLDKINNKISVINKLNEGLAKVKADVTKKIELIYESMYELQDEIYSDDPWLRPVELEKIDAIIDEALNIILNMICGKVE